ncbi:hypothetical protein [Kamptonema sp. UHCC 0994]|uniref:hypothetical protein n=1 Tax=Kamptonema sp. UHCC 0994 TaxID=3031329 RepID=UPI0023B94AAE|nr:hypothetical protein [Kamptonema sp. UHCC 0994]MDF0552696.1 hypothetical protein [Kamptonema sp. UHCC 0994]
MIRPYSARISAKIFNRACVTIAVLGISVGCSPTQQRHTAVIPTPKMTTEGQSSQSILAQNLNKTQKSVTASSCVQSDAFSESVNFANKAAILVQSASSKADWDEVSRYWVQAVAWMQAVPPGNPKRAFAEKKVVEYMRYLNYSQQQAATLRSQVNSASFSSELLDQQLQLYLSYIATLGPPDVLIVGSSRALQGVDPRQLQQSLAFQGYLDLKVFNFGVNGATAQVVEYQLRRLLTPQQMPQMILWADGVRAFNSGRIDRTFNAIATSEGNKMLAAGIRPKLSQNQPQNTRQCYKFPQPCNATLPGESSTKSEGEALTVSYSEEFNSEVRIFPQLPTQDLGRVRGHRPYQTQNFFSSEGTLAQASLDGLDNAIDSNGFLGLSVRYNPDTYYNNRPFVAGSYDGDYSNFALDGKQTAALSAIANFAKSRKIPLVFVNLPLTEDYLDSVRWRAEQTFRQRMQRLAQEKGFIFRDLSQQWPKRNDYFVDPSHLNRYGAIAVSEQLATDLGIPWPQPRR